MIEIILKGERVWHLAESEEECGNYSELYQSHEKPYDLCSEVGLKKIIFGSVSSLRSDNVRLSITVISCLEHSILHLSLLGLSQVSLSLFVIKTVPKVLCLVIFPIFQLVSHLPLNYLSIVFRTDGALNTWSCFINF